MLAYVYVLTSDYGPEGWAVHGVFGSLRRALAAAKARIAGAYGDWREETDYILRRAQKDTSPPHFVVRRWFDGHSVYLEIHRYPITLET